jgi:hypothetical protein
VTANAGALDAGGFSGGSVVRLGSVNTNAGALTPTAADVVTFTNIRLLGTSLTEDTPGGFYGGTILTDLIGLFSSLFAGTIEAGSDFAIPAIEAGVRTMCDQVVTEVASYYAREWAVWESGRFDWKTPNLDEAQWVAPLTEIESLNIKASLDGLTSNVFVLYTNATDGNTAEQIASTSDTRNPFTKLALGRDLLVQAPAVMTASTASALAALRVGEMTFPLVTGQIVVPITKLLRNAVGTRLPAALIRAGQNILIPDLPKTEVLRGGRDGETLFHVVSVEADEAAGTVTLQLEGQSSAASVIAARLAAVTRVVAG